MECLGVEPGAAWWKAQTNPLSYGGTHYVANLSYISNVYYCGIITNQRNLQVLSDFCCSMENISNHLLSFFQIFDK